MRKGLQIQVYKLLSALSQAMDYNRSGLMRHHQRVALISLALADEMGLSEDHIPPLFCGAVVHDAGTSTFQEKASLEHFETTYPWCHCQRGYDLLSKAKILAPLAPVLLHHHDRWDGTQNPSGLKGDGIPLPSRIIFLADRVDVLAQMPGNILDRRDYIIQKIAAGSGTMFDPELVAIFIKLARKEHFWFDLTSPQIDNHLERRIGVFPLVAGQEEIIDVSRIFADVIDSKSPFTYRHSRLVSEVASFLSGQAGFSNQQRKQIYVAGLLHDLGKLSIPEEILEKPGALNEQEYNIIKQHPYITYHILDKIDGFAEIKAWASYHHETLNGEGYPFHLGKEDLSTGSRIMGVADIFSALVEDRPYRKGLPREKVEKIMSGMTQSGAIDGDVVDILMDNYREAYALKDFCARETAQKVQDGGKAL